MSSGADRAEFAATPIGAGGPARSRVVLAALAAVAVLVVVVAKPWEGSAAPAGATSDRARSPTTAVPIASARIVSAADALPWVLPGIPQAGVAAAIRPHRSWGLRAIAGDPNALDEIWLAAPPPGDAPGEPDHERLVLDPGDRAVLLVGYTLSPGTSSVVGVRVARLGSHGRYERLPVQLVGLMAFDEAIVLIAPRDGGEWQPGTYRLRALLRDNQVTLPIEISRSSAHQP